MVAVVPQWSEGTGNAVKTSDVNDMWRVSSYPDLMGKIHSSEDLFKLEQDCKVSVELPLISQISYDSEASDASERMNFAELGFASGGDSSHSTPSLSSAASLSAEFSSLKQPQTAGVFKLSLDTKDVARDWQTIAGPRRPMGLAPMDLASLAPAIPSADHISASLNCLIRPGGTNFVDCTGSMHLQRSISSCSQLTDAVGGLQHVVPDYDVSSRNLSSSGNNGLVMMIPIKVEEPSRPRLPMPAHKPASKKSKSVAKRSRNSNRSFVDKRPRYKGRFVRPEELEMLLALEKNAAAQSESHDDVAVVPTSEQVNVSVQMQCELALVAGF